MKVVLLLLAVAAAVECAHIRVIRIQGGRPSLKTKRFSDFSLGGLAPAGPGNFSPVLGGSAGPWVPITGQGALARSPAGIWGAAAPSAPALDAPAALSAPSGPAFDPTGLYAPTAPAATEAPKTEAPTEAPTTAAPVTTPAPAATPAAIPTDDPVFIQPLPPIVTLGVAGPYAAEQLSIDALNRARDFGVPLEHLSPAQLYGNLF